jgi:hypothetical protein
LDHLLGDLLGVHGMLLSLGCKVEASLSGLSVNGPPAGTF